MLTGSKSIFAVNRLALPWTLRLRNEFMGCRDRIVKSCIKLAVYSGLNAKEVERGVLQCDRTY